MAGGETKGKRTGIIVFMGILSVMALGILFLFFQQRKGPSGKQENQLRIAAVMLDPEVVFWGDVWAGTRDAAKDQGIALSEYPYDQYSTDVASLIEMALLADVDGILLRSQDIPGEALYETLETVRDGGKIVVALDVDAGEDYRDAFLSIDNTKAAEALAEKASKLVASGESIAIVKITDRYMSHAALVRVEAFRSAFEKRMPDCPIHVVDLPVEDGLRLPALIDFLKKEPDVGMLFGCAPKVTSVCINGVTRLHLSEAVRVVGFSESKEALEAVEAGKVQCLVMQEPYQMGKSGLEYLIQLCTAEEREKESQIVIPFRLVTPEDF